MMLSKVPNIPKQIDGFMNKRLSLINGTPSGFMQKIPQLRPGPVVQPLINAIGMPKPRPLERTM